LDRRPQIIAPNCVCSDPRGEGKTYAEIATLMDSGSQMQTPALKAIFGFIGTILTGFMGSLVFAAFLKKNPAGA
jgi:hypothetical protein